MVAIVHLDLGVMESTTVKVLAVGFSSYIIIYFGVSLRVIVKFETLLTIFSSSSPPCFSSLSLSLYISLRHLLKVVLLCSLPQIFLD